MCQDPSSAALATTVPSYFRSQSWISRASASVERVAYLHIEFISLFNKECEEHYRANSSRRTSVTVRHQKGVLVQAKALAVDLPVCRAYLGREAAADDRVVLGVTAYEFFPLAFEQGLAVLQFLVPPLHHLRDDTKEGHA